jgi:hypothetical protein
MFYSCGLCGQITEVKEDGTVKVLSAIHDRDRIDWNRIVQINTDRRQTTCNCSRDTRLILMKHKDSKIKHDGYGGEYHDMSRFQCHYPIR